MPAAGLLHVAIVMDGNGRWATRRGLPRTAGHRAGAQGVRPLVEAAPALGVGGLTLFAFSADNWKRPTNEVSALMRLFARHLRTETPRLIKNGVHLEIVGRRDRLPAPLVAAMEDGWSRPPWPTTLHLRLAVDYSARWAIATGNLLPDVDLLIRTGGGAAAQRLSPLGMRLRRAAFHRADVAGIRRRGIGGCPRGIPRPRTAVRQRCRKSPQVRERLCDVVGRGA